MSGSYKKEVWQLQTEALRSFGWMLVCCILFSFHSFSQDSIVIKGRFVDNTKYAKVIMKKFGIGTIPVGGATIKKDSFSLAIPSNIDPGVYRFQYAMSEGEQFIDLIINGKEKEIHFTIKANDPMALPRFTASEENKLWYFYLEENRKQLEKISLLNQFINAYPNVNTAVVKAAVQEWKQEKELYWQRFATFKSQTQGTWANQMVTNRPYYFTNPKEDARLQDFEKREHFWDGFDANNPLLINSPLYSEHILNYLRYWMNPNMNFSAQEKTNGFKRAVDVIIRKFSGHPETQAFAYKYLTLGFKEIAEEEVLQYLDENYVDMAAQCFDAFEKTEFEKRMTAYVAIKAGNLAPDFELKEINNNPLSSDLKKRNSLYKLKDSQILIVFWSSSCPHCIEELPKLNEWAGKQNSIKVVAVSLDTTPETLTESIKLFPNFLHSCDYMGWDTEAAKKYFIAATPTFIVLDKNKKIVGKWSSFNQVISQIK